MNLIKDRTQEIKNELALLNHTLKMSVQKAIRIGELLTEQKEFVGHGNFNDWVETNLDIGRTQAWRFMKVFEHQAECSKMEHLKDAYQQIETLEAQERQSKEERERTLIAEYRKTGKKPVGWNSSLDYRIKKDDEAFAKQRERIEGEKREREKRAASYKQQPTDASHITSAMLNDAADALIYKLDKKEAWKEKIRLSDGGKEDAFMDAIIEYLETLPNDTRRIEACNNIIKICRNISVELQKPKNKEQ